MAISLPVLLSPVIALLGLGLGLGALLGAVARKFHRADAPVVESINDLLPQTQCGQCGYPGCKPYAEAIANGDAINKCPPGGEKTIAQLAALLNVQALPLDEEYGKAEVRKVAFIREAECIGCAKCIPACPVDAILGAPKFMHTVIESECTGCDLCVEPCPVDCIDMLPVDEDQPPVAPPPDNSVQPCINCGLCVPVCPVDIQPHELYRACRNGDTGQAHDLNLMHCIECGKCDTVCPSHIPLLSFYQYSKAAWLFELKEKQRAEHARIRFENHQQRKAKLAENEEKRRQKRADLAANREKVSAESIQAALARVKAKKSNQGKLP